VTETVKRRRKAIHHIVHDYANFVSSAEMTITGVHKAKGFDPPVNTHIGHAFYLNCRKMADFFSGSCKDPDDILAGHYASTTTFSLPVFDKWRGPINKQLAHLTYTRDTKAREITRQAQEALYKELKAAWKTFGKHLPQPYRSRFDREINLKLGPKSEFHTYDLGW
jgi:hypothetical protein